MKHSASPYRPSTPATPITTPKEGRINSEKYSKEKFETLGLNTSDARKLAHALEVEVNEVIRSVVRADLKKVADDLNEKGHRLTIYGDSRGDISFRDEPNEGQCHLRLGCNIVTSAGYAHDAPTLSQQARDSISKKLESTWERYIDAIHRFIALNISLIIGLAGLVSFLLKLKGEGDAPTLLESKRFLIGGFVLLMGSLVCEIGLRIWAQLFMEYEILQPTADVDKYFAGVAHYTWSYRLKPGSYAKHSKLVRLATLFAALFFLAGLGSSLVFLYQNLR
ncbi:MAG: hypothetical protein ABI596_13190 [Pyrinomonadaceae bacterium]